MKRFIIIVAVALVAIWGLVRLRTSHQAAGAHSAEAAPIPVAIGTARLSDVPLYLDGIGTVQALYTVSIHPMVDGPLVDVHFREGQDVRQGDLLAQIDPRTYQATYDQAVAKKAQDEATLENARRDLTRYEKLAKTQYATAQQADTQRATVAQDEAIVRQDQAQIDSARTNLSYTTMKAPVSGRVGIRQVDAGNIVHSTDTTPITVLTTLQPIAVVFTLPQQTLPDVVTAMQTGTPDVLALPQSGDPSQILGHGKLEVLDNQVDQNTGTIKLKAIFPNTQRLLWPGAFTNVRLQLRTEHNVTTVPISAVQRGPEGAFVFTVDKDNVAHRQEVVIPHQDDRVAIVSKGLQAGERVIVDGASRVTDRAHVTEVSGQPAVSRTESAG